MVTGVIRYSSCTLTQNSSSFFVALFGCHLPLCRQLQPGSTRLLSVHCGPHARKPDVLRSGRSPTQAFVIACPRLRVCSCLTRLPPQTEFEDECTAANQTIHSLTLTAPPASQTDSGSSNSTMSNNSTSSTTNNNGTTTSTNNNGTTTSTNNNGTSDGSKDNGSGGGGNGAASLYASGVGLGFSLAAFAALVV